MYRELFLNKQALHLPSTIGGIHFSQTVCVSFRLFQLSEGFEGSDIHPTTVCFKILQNSWRISIAVALEYPHDVA